MCIPCLGSCGFLFFVFVFVFFFWWKKDLLGVEKKTVVEFDEGIRQLTVTIVGC